MRTIAKTCLPEVRQWATKLHHRGAPGAIRLNSRWFAWAQALRDHRAHPAAPTGGVERTLLRRTWLLMSFIQRFAPLIQLGWQTSTATTVHGQNRTLVVPLPPLPQERTTLLQTLLSREHSSQSTIFQRTGFHRYSTQFRVQEAARHMLTRMMMEPARSQGAKSLSHTDAADGARGSRVEETEQLPLAKRVLLQHRRLDVQVAPPQTVLRRRSIPPAREAQFHESVPLSQVRPASMNSAWTPFPTQSRFTINQITDEVVRQLDGRLVAARERFGKI
jgi:hypothetical protein